MSIEAKEKWAVLDDNEVERVLRGARAYAAKRGHSELADDFSQEVFIARSRGWTSTLEQLFSGYLRTLDGDPRTLVGAERRIAKARTVSLDAPAGDEDDGTLRHDLIGYSREHPEHIERDRTPSLALTGRNAQIYDLAELDGLNQREIAERLGITASRICQLLKPMQRQEEFEAQHSVLAEQIEAMNEDPERFKLAVDWIKL